MEIIHSVKGLVPHPASSNVWGWSQASHAQPLLAVAAGGNAIGIYTSQGAPWAPAKGTVRNIRGTDAAALAWHPHKFLLAIAWQDGAVSVWDAARSHLEEDSKVHRQAICHLVWDPSGTHLLTADTQGKVVLWELDNQQQPQAKCSVTEKGYTITHVTSGKIQAAGSSIQCMVMVYYAISTLDSCTVTVKWLDESGRSGVVQDVGESLLALLHYPEKQQLLAVTHGGSAIVLGNSSTSGAAGEWSVMMRVKFAGISGGAKLQVCWAGPHTLATATDQNSIIRLFQLDTDDNYALDPNQAEFQASEGDVALSGNAQTTVIGGISALAYDVRQQVLASATVEGRVCLFRHLAGSGLAEHAAAAAEPANQWEPHQSFQAGKQPASLQWGPSAQVLAVECADGLHLCTRAMLHHKLCEGYAVIQDAAGRVVLEQLDGVPRPPGRLATSLQLAGLDVTANALLLHDGMRAHLYRLNSRDNSITELSQFDSPGVPGTNGGAARTEAGHDSVVVFKGVAGGCAMALYNESVYRTAERKVEVCNLSGVVKQTLAIDEAQGQPLLLDTHNEYLAVLTSKALVRIFRLAGREAKPHAGPGLLLPASVTRGLQIDAIRINCNGSLVCAVGSQLGGGSCQDPRVFVYSAELNGPLVFDFTQDRRAPRTVFWDLRDPRLLAVQTGPLTFAQVTSRSSSRAGSDEGSSSAYTPGPAAAHQAQTADDVAPQRCLEVAIMFVTPDAGLLLQEFQNVQQAGASGFLGVCAPHLLLHKKAMIAAPGAPPHSTNITQVLLLGFSGLGDADDATRQALLDFNYNLAVGRSEEAFRAVAALRSPAVWRSMAHMAIKNKRLDVAELCLGNMEHVRGARALRESSHIPHLDARVGLVAVQLGLPDDAARLFAGSEHWDLLEQLHKATGHWEAAIDVAAKQDRIHLQSVHYTCAQHLESIGDYKAAMQHYIDSGTAASEVPRMLWQLGELPALEQLVMQSCDTGMLTWWAKYCESKGKYEQAFSCYQRAGNQLATLRIHCATGNWQAAEELMAATEDPAAAFHLARIYEAQDKVADALRCYGISKRYSHGARVAKRCGMDQELLSFALKSPPSVMLEAADYLLASGNPEAAALLYQKGGKLGKALDMALSSGLYEVLDSIAEQLDQDQDPDLMARCAEAFTSAGHNDKAVALLVRARQPSRALDLLVQHAVPLTEELAEALTPEKTPDNADSRSAVLLRIAQAAKHQRLYHLACKKYTQAGDRLKAMRALVKSGDTDKIVFFAGMSRQPEVYIMAANYLQTLDWRSEPDHLKNIINFYTKARAADKLAHFYMSCAQLEIDHFKAYGKALQALQEASKHLAKSRATDKDEQLAALETCMQRISRFSTAQDVLPTDPAGAVTICQQLLQELPEQQGQAPDVRAGDIYALLIDWCCQEGNMPQALQLVQQMADHCLQPQAYLSHSTLSQMQQATGAPLPTIQQQQQQAVQSSRAAAGEADEVPDEVEEQLPYIQDDDYVD